MAGAECKRAWRPAAFLGLALAAAGCSSNGQPMASLASGRGATVAFESIDGPPQAVFQELVENLATEAVAHQVRVISRETTPSYRVRAYMAANVQGKHIHIGWVWDVYDANKQRVLRIASEESGARSGADAWGAVDEAMLRRIARTGMDGIAAFLGGGGKTPAEPGNANGTAVAAAGDGPRAAAGFARGEPQTQPADPAAPRAQSSLPSSPSQRGTAASALAAALALADARP
jgi:hypothetical protein